jgi:DNA repair protein RadC
MNQGEGTPIYHATIHDLPTDERPRERMEHYGPLSLQTAELLALIIRTGTRQDNAIETSYKLLAKYGGLQGLSRAEFGELCQEYGLGSAKVAQIKAALEIGRRLALTGIEDRPRITSPADVMSLLGVDMISLCQEQLRLLLLDSKNGVVEIRTVYQGTVNASLVRVAEVLRPAIARNCPAIILTHNHPSGDPTPSNEDRRVTEQIFQAAKLMDIKLLDHIIIGQGRFVSLKESGVGFSSPSL